MFIHLTAMKNQAFDAVLFHQWSQNEGQGPSPGLPEFKIKGSPVLSAPHLSKLAGFWGPVWLAVLPRASRGVPPLEGVRTPAQASFESLGLPMRFLYGHLVSLLNFCHWRLYYTLLMAVTGRPVPGEASKTFLSVFYTQGVRWSGVWPGLGNCNYPWAHVSCSSSAMLQAKSWPIALSGNVSMYYRPPFKQGILFFRGPQP